MTDRPPWVDDPRDIVRENSSGMPDGLAERAIAVLDEYDASNRGTSPANAAAIAIYTASVQGDMYPLTKTKAAELVDGANRGSVSAQSDRAVAAYDATGR